jgi:hypothetical protein
LPAEAAATAAALPRRHDGEALGDGGGGADNDDDDDSDGADGGDDDFEAAAAAAAAAGLPVAFAVSAKRKRRREAAAADATSLSSAAAAKRARAQASGDAAGASDAAGTGAASSGGSGGGGGTSDALEALGLPVSHEAVLTSAHGKGVTAVAFDAAGGRLFTGGSDYSVKMFDFGGMDATHRAFREFVPEDGQPITALSVSPAGDRLAVATSSARLHVFDREGGALLATVKGDPYLRDVSLTRGHTGGVCGVLWHPAAAETLVSGSADGTLRLWPEGEPPKLLAEFGLPLNTLVALPDGTLATGSVDGMLRLVSPDGAVREVRAGARPVVARTSSPLPWAARAVTRASAAPITRATTSARASRFRPRLCAASRRAHASCTTAAPAG